MSALPGTLDRVKELTSHPAFSIRNPNKVRALIGVFASANPVRFHAKDGSGYTFLADRVIELDRLTPPVAAPMVAPLRRLKKFDAGDRTSDVSGKRVSVRVDLGGGRQTKKKKI